MANGQRADQHSVASRGYSVSDRGEVYPTSPGGSPNPYPRSHKEGVRNLPRGTAHLAARLAAAWTAFALFSLALSAASDFFCAAVRIPSLFFVAAAVTLSAAACHRTGGFTLRLMIRSPGGSPGGSPVVSWGECQQ